MTPAHISARRPVADPVLPQLEALLDMPGMARQFERHFANSGGGQSLPWMVRSCEIERVKYRPRRNCVVGYRLRVATAGRNGVAMQRVAVAMYAPEEARRRHASAIERWPAGVDARLPPVSLLSELDLVVWMFPYDRKLPALPLLASAAYVRDQCLPALIAAHWGAAWRLVSARHRIVGYFPEHGCTVRVKARLANATSGQTSVWTLFGKTRYDDAGAQTFVTMRRIWDGAAQRQGAVGFARPLHYDPSQRLLWQEGITADTLDHVLAHARSEGPASVGLGRAIAALHAIKLDLPPRLTLEAILEELRRAAGTVVAVDPALRSDVEALVDDLIARASRLPSSPLTTVHGDLHSRNVLIGGGRVFIVDMDRVSAGLPMAELGSVLAEFAFRDILGGRAINWRRIAAIVEEYREHVPHAVLEPEVAWHLAAALIRERAYRGVSSIKPGRIAALPRILAAARDALSHGLSAAAARPFSAALPVQTGLPP